MENMERIRSLNLRTAKAIEKHPDLAQRSKVASARLVDGLTCEVKVGEFTLISDMPDVAGGNNKGPTPGDLCEAAVASCLAIGIAYAFADLGLSYSNLEVKLAVEFDIRKIYGVVSDAPLGFSDLSYTVNVESSASEADIYRALDRADARGFMLDNLRRPLEIRRNVQISALPA